MVDLAAAMGATHLLHPVATIDESSFAVHVLDHGPLPISSRTQSGWFADDAMLTEHD